MNKVYTGCYQTCKVGNLISISGDRGKCLNFNGKAIPQLAPKRSFWNEWHNNIGRIPFYDNTRYYIQEYCRQVLLNVNILKLLENEKEPILLCYESSDDFCHRHVLAEYINLMYGIEVFEIEINDIGEIIYKQRPKYIREILEEVICNNSIFD